MSWTIAEIRAWYPERFADNENDNQTVREAFAVLFRTLDVGEILLLSAQNQREGTLIDLHQCREHIKRVLDNAEENYLYRADHDPEYVDKVLREYGYDPEQLGKDMAAFVRKLSDEVGSV